jgi:hypothetical protein
MAVTIVPQTGFQTEKPSCCSFHGCEIGHRTTLSGCNVGAAVNVPVQYNSAQYGGAIANFGTMTVSSCFMAGNSAYGGSIGRTFFPGEGGAIYNGGWLTVSNSVFGGNNPPYTDNSPDNIFGPYTDGGGNTFK